MQKERVFLFPDVHLILCLLSSLGYPVVVDDDDGAVPPSFSLFLSLSHTASVDLLQQNTSSIAGIDFHV
jgi:hypothetical protein